MKLQVIAGFVASWVLASPMVAAEIPPVEASIPESIKALGDPATSEFPNGIHMAVTTASDKAQTFVNQGLNHLHGGWEIQASRHFAMAMREDPECLLAHWGMVMSLLTPSPESKEARDAATLRFLELYDQQNASELERGYARGLIRYLNEGPAAAANTFRHVSEKFPNDYQAAIFAALFSRNGYDELGSARPDQEAAEDRLLALIHKHPLSPVPLNALLTIRAEAPDAGKSIQLARKLIQISPEYGPYQHLLGHYEWRSGNHDEALRAFSNASSFYKHWMEKNNATAADSPEWVKAESYQIVTRASMGKYESALASAMQLASTRYPETRSNSPGARLLMWDAESLPARILLARGQPGDADKALESLGKPKGNLKERKQTLSHGWNDGLRFILDAKRQLEMNQPGECLLVLEALAQHGINMQHTQPVATAFGERSYWMRSFRALETLASNLRGQAVLAGPPDRIGTAYNWFASAADSQRPASLLMPPAILSPMAIHLGDFLLRENQTDEAIAAYERALALFPNHPQALTRLKEAFLKAGHPDKTADIEENFDSPPTD
jgi:tetratricopeptide (TPR) repeat protein